MSHYTSWAQTNTPHKIPAIPKDDASAQAIRVDCSIASLSWLMISAGKRWRRYNEEGMLIGRLCRKICYVASLAP